MSLILTFRNWQNRAPYTPSPPLPPAPGPVHLTPMTLPSTPFLTRVELFLEHRTFAITQIPLALYEPSPHNLFFFPKIQTHHYFYERGFNDLFSLGTECLSYAISSKGPWYSECHMTSKLQLPPVMAPAASGAQGSQRTTETVIPDIPWWMRPLSVAPCEVWGIPQEQYWALKFETTHRDQRENISKFSWHFSAEQRPTKGWQSCAVTFGVAWKVKTHREKRGWRNSYEKRYWERKKQI